MKLNKFLSLIVQSDDASPFGRSVPFTLVHWVEIEAVFACELLWIIHDLGKSWLWDVLAAIRFIGEEAPCPPSSDFFFIQLIDLLACSG
jgi:hypothetical protein